MAKYGAAGKKDLGRLTRPRDHREERAGMGTGISQFGQRDRLEFHG